MAGLMDIIEEKLDARDISDRNWYRFVYDHIDILKSKSKLVSLSTVDQTQYEYQFTLYLSQKAKLPLGMHWIVGLINDINTNIAFTNVATLYIPDYQTIDSLYQKYTGTDAQPVNTVA